LRTTTVVAAGTCSLRATVVITAAP
jgi:hypothetical protein